MIDLMLRRNIDRFFQDFTFLALKKIKRVKKNMLFFCRAMHLLILTFKKCAVHLSSKILKYY